MSDMLLELLTFSKNIVLCIAIVCSADVKHFKTNAHNILRPGIKNFPKSTVYYMIQTILNCDLRKGQASKP